MDQKKIASLFNSFQVEAIMLEAAPYGNGHINDTILIKTSSDKNYILQRKNHNIFNECSRNDGKHW